MPAPHPPPRPPSAPVAQRRCGPPAVLELHIARSVRDRLGLDAELFTLTGRAVFANIEGARRLAAALAREAGELAADAATPGRLFAIGLIHELLHAAIARYRERSDPNAFRRALEQLAERLGGERVDRALAAFLAEFPPAPVYRGEIGLEEFLAGESEGRSHREIVLEELLLLWLANLNPALGPLRPLFDDRRLRAETAYLEIIAELEAFFDERPPVGAAETVGGNGRSLVEALKAPLLDFDPSIGEQLEQLSHAALHRLPPAPTEPPPPAALDRPPAPTKVLKAADLLREEERPVFPPGPGPVEVPAFEETPLEPGRFSPDRDWMPELVLVAKNVYVWLDQISRTRDEPVETLDAVPDEELRTLAERGFTGLWLIGVWERSPASKQIKRLCGNPEAEGSAYSIDDYRVAETLGGTEALDDLAARAERYGIRLASDMVPNHFGVDSHWVREYPERFLSLAEPPFASYTFDGPDLSSDPSIGLFLEDHYYDRSDAAVVFKRVDHEAEETRYLYHGNDGTSTPWNDTAQLDYLQEEVREAVIEEILEVARHFPIIRFDAAMTLARRHVRRLWHPVPGDAGAIPSRTEFGVGPEAFDAAMPEEFWRQVVDRVAEEAPDTLLLAEAFWLMESYFVRTLGMHRVYNSAFMVMLREGRNADYRQALANVLAYDPEVLKRYVNFLNNPDEETAVEQFGAGERYLGVATLLSTLPGLPMFGHGQVEGLTEKYGMEYRRAYRDEKPNSWLVAQHRRRIAPLLARRELFAESADFRLYDLELPPGAGGAPVDENVFAYSNRFGDERVLVVFHHRGGKTRGRIRRSVPYAVEVADPEESEATRATRDARLRRSTLAEALGIEAGGPPILLCRDQVTGLQHLFDTEEILDRGLALALGPYQCQVFWEIELRDDPDRRLQALAASLAGAGIASLEEALREPELLPILTPLREILRPSLLRRLLEPAERPGGPAAEAEPAAEAPAASPAASEGEVESSALDRVLRAVERLARALADYLRATASETEAETRSEDGRAEVGPTSDDETDETDEDERLAETVARLTADIGADLARAVELLRPAGEAPGGPGDEAGDAPRDDDAFDGASPDEAAGPVPATGSEDEAVGGSPGDDRLPLDRLRAGLAESPERWIVLVAWLVLRRLGALDPATTPQAANEATPGATPRASAPDPVRGWLDDLLLAKPVAAALGDLGLGEAIAHEALLTLKVLAGGTLPAGLPAIAALTDAEGQEPGLPVVDADAAPAEGDEPTQPAEPTAPSAIESTDEESAPDDAGPEEAAEQEALPDPAADDAATETDPGDEEASKGVSTAGRPLPAWLADPDVRLLLRLNTWDGQTWYHRESFELLLWWNLLVTVLEHGPDSEELAAADRRTSRLEKRAEADGYRFDLLVRAVRD